MTDNLGATASTTKSISATNSVVAAFTATPSAGVAPLSSVFDASTSTAANATIVGYSWDLGNGQSASSKTASATYTLPGKYTVTLTVLASNGLSDTTSREVFAQQRQSPVASFTAASLAGVNKVLLDGSRSIDPDGTIVSYVWNLGNGQTVTGTSPTVGYVLSGKYSVTLTVTDNDGLISTTTQDIFATTCVQSGAALICGR